MNKFSALLRLNLRAMLSSVHLGGKKNTHTASDVGALVLMAGLACYLSATYSFLFASQLSAAGELPLILLMMPVMAVIMGIFFTLFAAQGVVFGGKDNDLMLSLPVSPFTLMLSRTLALYLENLVFSLFTILPAGAAYLYFGGQGGIRFACTLLLCTPFLALLPCLISLICGFILAWFRSKFIRVPLLSTILYFVFFGLLMVSVFQLNGQLMNLAAAAAGIRQGFTGWGLPFLLLQRAACNGDLPALFGFMAICLLPFLAAVWLFAGRYKRIITGLTARGARSDYQLDKLVSSSSKKALLRKEASRFFGTPIYIFNTGFGLILMLAASVAALVMRRRLLGLWERMGIDLPLMPVLAAMLALLISTAAITASSISLEGNHLWILKEAPISTDTLFAMKVVFQLLLTLPCLLISVICLGIAGSIPLWQFPLLFFVVGVYAVFTALFGLYVNLCFPKLDAPNDMVVVKQSASAVIATFGSMLLALAGVGFFVLVWRAVGASVAVALCAIFFAAGSIVMVRLLQTTGQQMFRQLT